MSELVDEFKNEFKKEFLKAPFERSEVKLNNLYYQLHINDRIYFTRWLEEYLVSTKVSVKGMGKVDDNFISNKSKLALLKLWLKRRIKYAKHPKLILSKVDIIDLINFDLNIVQKVFERQINYGEVKRYFFASNRRFLDYDELGKCLRETNNLNSYKESILKNFIIKIDKLLKLYNEDLGVLEKLTDQKEIWNSIYIEGFGTYSFNKNYETYRIDDLKYSSFYLTTREMRVDIFNHYVVEDLDNYHFAYRCNQILGRITGFLGINSNEALQLVLNNTSKSTFIPENSGAFTNPHIFENVNASKLFEALVIELKGCDNPLVEYSYVYRIMAYEKLLRPNASPKSFMSLLHDLQLLSPDNDRLKVMNEIGNQAAKRRLYDRVKNNMES